MDKIPAMDKIMVFAESAGARARLFRRSFGSAPFQLFATA